MDATKPPFSTTDPRSGSIRCVSNPSGGGVRCCCMPRRSIDGHTGLASFNQPTTQQIKHLKTKEYKNVHKRERTVSRAYGGSRCANCVRDR